MSAKYKSPSFLLPNELNTSANTANNTGINSLYSMDFDGTEYIDCGLGVAGITGAYNADLSISAWFKKSSCGFHAIFGNDSPTGGYGQGHLSLYEASNTITFSCGTNARLKISYQYNNDSCPNFDSNWHHVVGIMTYSSGSFSLQMYFDGNSVGTTTGSAVTNQVNFSYNSYIGSLGQNVINSRYFNGQIDEVAIFNRALNTTQIAALYDGTGSNIRPSNLMAANLNPIAYYPLGEQAQNSGYLSATGNEWQFPNGVLQDYVMDFDGTYDIDTKLTIDSTYSALTISAWVNFNNLTNFSAVLGQWRNNSFPNSTVLLYLDNTSKIQVLFSSGSSYVSAGLNTTLQTNRWYNLIVLWDGSTVKLYVDGSVQSTTGSLSSLNNSDVTLKIGCYNNQTGNGTTNNIDGQISNVAIWNTDQSANIADIYNSGSPQTSYTVAPQNWWKLNADSVYTPSAPNYTTALDFNGTNNYVNAGRVLSAENTSTLSVSFWLKISSTGAKYYLGYYIGNFGAGWLIEATTTIVYFAVGDTSTGYQSFGLPYANNITANTWYNIVMVFDGTQTGSANILKVYINGTQKTLIGSPSFPASIPTLDATAEFTIGGIKPSAVNGQKTISNVSVFNSALTSSQVSTLFNFGTPEVTPSFSPQAWWKLDNTTTGIQDSSGNGYNGTNSTNSATVASTPVVLVPSWKIPTALTIPSANYTTALDFVASESDYVEIANSSSLNFTANQDFSLSAWVKKSSNGWYGHILKKGSIDPSWLFRFNNNNKLYFLLETTGGVNTNSESTVAITDTEWHHVVAVADRSSSLKIYLDGVDVSGSSGSSSFDVTNTGTLRIGTKEDGSEAFNGEISNASVFNTALTPSQVSTLFNFGTPQTAISFSPVGWWKLDTGGSTITDYGSGGNNGTNNGATKVFSNVVAGNIPVNGVSTTLPSTALQQSDLQFDSPYSNYSLSFDGTGDYIDTNYIFPTISTWSYSYWVNITDPGNSNYFYQVTARDSSTTGLLIWSGNGSTSSQRNFSIKMENSATMTFSVSSFNTWYHIVVTGDGSNLTAYVDGLQVSTLATSTLFSTLTYTTKIGSNKDGTNYFLNGKIDETSIFNYTLSHAQILEIYNNGKPGNLDNFSGTAPINWWRLGENAYFDNNTFTVPNSISGAPNGTGAGTVTSMLTADAPGTYANGVGTNLDIVDRVGDAPLSVANSQSYNMIPDDKIPYVPGYVANQISNTYSMAFDGVDNSFDLGSEILFDSTKGFSFSAWINLDSGAYTTSQYPGVFLLKTDQATGFSMFLSQTPSPSPGYQGINIGSNLNFVTIKTDGNISGDFLNTWKHVCLTFDGVDRTATSSYKIYVDGSSVALTNSYLFPAHNNENHLGRGANITNTYFPGNIDEVAIFDKTLTADQVKFDLYDATTTGKTADIENNTNLPTPLAWYRMGD